MKFNEQEMEVLNKILNEILFTANDIYDRLTPDERFLVMTINNAINA